MRNHDSSRVFAAAVYVLGHTPCPQCGCVHAKHGWNEDCAWCADRARALDLYRKWKTRDTDADGGDFERRIA